MSVQEKTTPATQNAEFSATHGEITAALKTAEFGIDPKAPHLAQRGVIIETADGQVTFTAHDFDTAVRVTVPCATGRTAGTSLLDHAELSRTLAALVAGEPKSTATHTPVTLTGDVLAAGAMAVPVTRYDLSSYPPAATPTPAQITVDGPTLLAQITRVLPAVGTDDTLPTLTGVQFTAAADSLALAATDRYRFAVADVPTQSVPDTAALPDDMNVPGHVLRRLTTPLKSHPGPVGIGVCESGDYATFTLGQVTLTTRLLDGRLPRYNKLFPKQAAASLQIGRAALVNATKKCSAIIKAKREDKLTPVSLLWDRDGNLTLAPALSEAADRARLKGAPLPFTAVGGDVTELHRSFQSLNHAYLADALACFTGDTVTFHLPGAEEGQGLRKPITVTDGPDIHGEGYSHLLMPVRLDHTWDL
ncbi:DNA polymerase III subunit beta [Streptomyces sp. NPDC048623]|uniref:DNA polymerase III subunit beta n=1 Tax=Streptomyces sp. NPDC048623 TaxID=3155761 RepID=UPI00341A3518